MKITVPAKSLKSAVDVASRYVTPASNASAYCHIKLSAIPAGTYLTAQGSTNGVRIPVLDCVTTDEVDVLLPTDKIVKILGSAGDEVLTLTFVGPKLQIWASRSRWEVSTMTPKDFVDWDYAVDGHDFAADATILGIIGDRASKISSDDEIKGFQCQCVSLGMAGDQLIAVATDGRKTIVSRTVADWDEHFDGKFVLVPTKSFAMIKATFGPSPQMLRVKFRQNEIAVASEGGTVALYRLAYGKYPLPSVFDTGHMYFSEPIVTTDFIRAISQAAAVIDGDGSADKPQFNPNTTIKIQLEAERFLIESLATEQGSAVVDFPARWAHEPVTIYLRPMLLNHVVKALDGLPFRLGQRGDGPIGIEAIGFTGLVCQVEAPESETGKAA